MRPTLLLSLAVLSLLLAGCGEPRDERWVVSRLYLGTGTPSGPVDEGALARFIDGTVAAAFPDGLTRYEATGQWRGVNGHTMHERTVVIEVVHHPGDAAAAAVLTVARDYRERFHQESVLVTESELEAVRFITK